MKRIHFIEIHEQSWCPVAIRDGLRGIIRFSANFLSVYRIILPRLIDAIRHTDSLKVIDLCSGAGGPWIGLIKSFPRENTPVNKIIMTDLFPDNETFKAVQNDSRGLFDFLPNSVDATNVPADLKGFRTLFTSFHHFKPEKAQAILRNVVENKVGIGIFEMTERSLFSILLMALSAIPCTLLIVPFIRPFRWSILFWTYIFPILPFIMIVDGVVSCLRTYSPKELAEFVAQLDDGTYEWEIGKERNWFSPMRVTYIIGYPRGT